MLVTNLVRRGLAPLVVATVVLTTGCVPDECDVTMTLGGAIDWMWVWSYPTTTCSVSHNPASTVLDFDQSTGSLRLELQLFNDQPGAFLTWVSYSENFETWDNGFLTDMSPACTVTVTEYEFVNWVSEDHHRIKGTLNCDGPLTSSDGSELYLSNVAFSIYAGLFDF